MFYKGFFAFIKNAKLLIEQWYYVLCIIIVVLLMTKENLKNKAIQLRKSGKSYSEILTDIPVAKSTLSLWLRSVNLSKKQKQTLTLKKLQACWRGGEVKKRKRIERSNEIIKQAKNDVGEVSDRDLWLAGIMLYWAEGSKEKEYSPGTGLIFGNSDVSMVRFYLQWLKKCLLISENRLVFEIYIHETHKDKIENVRQFWSEKTGLPLYLFKRVYFKKNKVNGNRKNKGIDYNGLLRITVRESSSLNRRVAGWIEGIKQQCGIV